MLLPDKDIFLIIKTSLFVSISAVVLAVLISVPLGAYIAIKKFPLKKTLIAFINTGMGLPPVVVGLVISLLLFRNGPLGSLQWLYTIKGMILAQVIIALPIITGLILAAFQGIQSGMLSQLRALGANNFQMILILLKEYRLSVLAAIIAGFGSIISEVGAVMMVGGNIKGETRVLTTSIVLETNKGNYEFAVALGIILLVMSLIINMALTYIQQKSGRAYD